MNDFCPGATLSLQPGGGGLNASMPPRAVWHITWDALRPDGSQPQFSAVANYLETKGYCPTIMWNPFTGYIEQYYPASQSARALAAWNEDGAVNVQVEVFFSPGCVVVGVKYATVADTPLIGLDTILEWMDSLGIPRTWPLGSPQWRGNSRDVNVWNAAGGHYGHCNVPDNTHTDPGPMPDITASHGGSVTVQPESAEPVAVPAPAAGLGDNQVRVDPGDTLSGIAVQFGVDLNALIAVNGITEPDLIFPGMILDLPEAAAAPAAPSGLPPYCTVDPGDTLSGIAEQFGVSLDYIISKNPGINADLIFPGQRINLI
jgi:LysM repeat protein